MARIDLDRLTTRLGEALADRVTRRGALGRLLEASLACAGIAFLASTQRPPQRQLGNGCKHSDGCDEDSKYCGLNNLLCDQFGEPPHPDKDPKQCAKCMQENGCPMGSEPQNGWEACCLCVGEAKKGRKYRYIDCCVHEDLTDNKPHWPKGVPECTGCYPLGKRQKACENLARCQGHWCKDNSWNAVCTMVKPVGECTKA